MGDPWERECERIKKGLEELVGDVEERDRLEKAGLPAAVGLTGGIKRKLMQLGEAVGVLAGDLERDASAKRISHEQFSQRQEMLEALVNHKERLQMVMKDGEQSERDQLFGGFGGGGGRERGEAGFFEGFETRGKDNAGLADLQKQKLREQDDQVGLISDSLKKQDQISVAIGDELGEHTKLLDGMSTGVGKTTGRVQDENVKITKLDEKAKLTGLWIGVMVQSVILLVLIVLLLI